MPDFGFASNLSYAVLDQLFKCDFVMWLRQLKTFCDVNVAARLIDLTACMYVPAPAGLLDQQ